MKTAYLLYSLIAACLLLCACSPKPQNTGPLAIAPVIDINTHDSKRDRNITIRLWAPASIDKREKYPLVIYAHGFGGDLEDSRWAAGYLASHGFIVAALRFPKTNGGDTDNLDMNDLLNQPGDISWVIDVATGLQTGLPDRLKDAVDDSRIALAGHSFGGLTTYLAAFDRELMEPRLKAAILLAAGAGDIFYPPFYETRALPMLLIHGDHDRLVEYSSTSAQAYERANAPRVLVQLVGGTHLGHGEAHSIAFNFDNLPCWLAADKLKDDGSITFHTDLQNRKSAAGVGDFSAPPPCQYPLPSGSTMSTDRQKSLSNEVMLAFLEYALADNPDEKRPALLKTLQSIDAAQRDVIIKSAL
ncbi:alpha/beta hydrolase family protein [Pseudohalioglobus lutimaris]|uniref:alpha/beta hydrolase family protein n=1 Tax=Pseudohalioglobus lutimaris TaxID=1737061 RepID=UPI0013FD8C48|nr:alpha/beta fold hydrolase [Pseudohalioglobus lutimaris]